VGPGRSWGATGGLRPRRGARGAPRRPLGLGRSRQRRPTGSRRPMFELRPAVVERGGACGRGRARGREDPRARRPGPAWVPGRPRRGRANPRKCWDAEFLAIFSDFCGPPRARRGRANPRKCWDAEFLGVFHEFSPSRAPQRSEDLPRLRPRSGASDKRPMSEILEATPPFRSAAERRS
jgi:hypothetical protein